MHELSNLHIRNYRSCKDTSLAFSSFVPMVGCNNGGKSNILAAIRWLLRPAALAEEDFNDPVLPVELTATITGITEELLQELAEEHRKRIAPYCAGGTLTIRRIQASPGGTAKNVVLEVRDPQVQDPTADDAWAKNPTGIDAAIKALFPDPIEIAAMDDAASDVSSAKSGTTISKLVAELMDSLEAHHGPALTEALHQIKRRLDADGEDRAPELVELDSQANAKLGDFFPGVTIRIHIPTPGIREIFKAGTIRVYEPNSPHGRDVSSLGHGAQRSIQMALVRHLADVRQASAQAVRRTLLLIDEPELYLHPGAIVQVRSALHLLSQSGYQVVFATHSPIMIGPNHIAETLIIRNTAERGTHALPRVSDAIVQVLNDAPSQAQALLALDYSAEILFADIVLVVEGRSEDRLLPDIYAMVTGYALSAHKLALVAPGGAGNIPKCLRILEAIGIDSRALADLDFAFRCAPAAGMIAVDDPDIVQFKARAASLSPQYGFALDEAGLPESNDAISASEAFAVVANDPTGAQSAASLHAKLLPHRIWLLQRGDFGQYLALPSTKEEVLLQYRSDLRENGCDAMIPRIAEIRDFIQWARNP